MNDRVTSRASSTASPVNLRAFESACVALWTVTAVLIATVYDHQRDYWFLLLSWTLVFPFTAIADEYVLLLRYSPGFFPLPWRMPRVPAIPAMVTIAFGWFFTLPLILVWRTGVINQFPLWEQALIVFAALVVWSFFVEWLGGVQNLWTYHWSGGRWSRWHNRGKVPVIVPVIDAVTYLLAFLLHGVAVRATESMAWPGALATSYLIYAGAFVAYASLNWLLIRRVLGVQPAWPEAINDRIDPKGTVRP